MQWKYEQAAFQVTAIIQLRFLIPVSECCKYVHTCLEYKNSRVLFPVMVIFSLELLMYKSNQKYYN